ncbi:MAG: hypothetical protein O2954_15065 [bacterium]|nr:hypothetical protein [bacterium]
MSRSYQSIDCNFYDELTLRVIQQEMCVLVILNVSGDEERVEAVIEDVYTKGDEEFLRLDNGAVVRLDRLIEVDGKIVPTD